MNTEALARKRNKDLVAQIEALKLENRELSGACPCPPPSPRAPARVVYVYNSYSLCRTWNHSHG